MSGPVLVFVEHAAGEPERLSLEALSFARILAGAAAGPVEAVLLGAGAPQVASTLLGHGVATAHVARDARLDAYAPAAWASVVGSLAVARAATALVGPGSDRGHEVLAHVAARARLPMAANVLSIAPGKAGNPWSLTRQRWGGSLLEDATLVAPLRIMTVAPHTFQPAEPAGRAGPESTVLAFQPEIADEDLHVRVVSREASTAGASLADARVVVGGGRGVGSADGFAALEELAALLGGTVGVSRAVTSEGWRPHAEQVGQTGTRIAPDLYVACGISGAIQHVVGCKAAKRILAINTDPDAPIMGVADYAVVGDLHQVVPAISAELRRRGLGVH